MISAKQMLSISIDGQLLRARASDAVSLSRTTTGWTLQRAASSPGRKHAGAEGPISDALSARHIYVYGTADSPPPEEVERRRAQAAYAAEWATRQSKLLLTFRTLADAEVKEADYETSNLVLFGSRGTNTVIARLSPRLPLALNPGAADYSLTYVYPMGTRYVVINSGLPWWTRADQTSRSGMPFVNVAYRAALTFGDFILFRGGLENVISEGRFNNDWTLPADALEHMRATHAVEIKAVQAKPAEPPKPRKPRPRRRRR
jgi:hypothetical protein